MPQNSWEIAAALGDGLRKEAISGEFRILQAAQKEVDPGKPADTKACGKVGAGPVLSLS